jgi:hypothetical protein
MVTLNKKESNRFIKKMLKKEKQPITKKDREFAKTIKKNMSKIMVTLKDEEEIKKAKIKEDKRRQELADKYNPMLRVNGKLCSRCQKNRATVNYANSILDWNHGFGERICQTCYDKIKHENSWYKEGRKDMYDEVITMIDKDINFQEDTVRHNPKYINTCEQRIIGMKSLKAQMMEKYKISKCQNQKRKKNKL